MAIQTFTALQVLTAAQQNALQANDYNQTVSAKTASYTLVAADKGTRITMNSASATTITVNTSLFAAGDTVFIGPNLGAGVCTITAGTATVSTSGSLALVANAGGVLYFTSAGVATFLADGVTAAAGGFIRTGGGDVGTGASVAYANCFSATYDSYMIIGAGINSAGNNINMTLTGLVTGYYVNSWYAAMNAAAALNATAYNNAAHFGPVNTIGTLGFIMYITNPSTAVAKTGIRQAQGGSTTGYEGYDSWFNASTSLFTGLTITPASGNLVSGNIQIYGLAKS